MTELEEKTIREHTYAENQERMKTVTKNMQVARHYNFYFNIIMTIVSVFGIYLWLCYTNAGIKMALTLAEEIGTISFPWYGATLFITPPIAVMSYLADVYLNKKLTIASMLLYLVLLLFSLTNLILRYEPMALFGMILLIVYSVAGLWTEDFALRSYKELDYLKTQEGFPDFNYGIEIDRHSRFVKYREAWLKKGKKQDYYTDNERPVTEFAVVPAVQDDRMDGISVDSAICDQWFDNSASDSENKPEASEAELDMDYLEADPEMLPDSSEYEIDDIRRKPL